jgi:hypothetical protein
MANEKEIRAKLSRFARILLLRESTDSDHPELQPDRCYPGTMVFRD